MNLDDDNKSKNPQFNAIEFSMLDKKLFIPLSSFSSFTVQTFLFPIILIRTRLQIQDRNSVYKGLTHAITKIYKDEGIKGFYSGYFLKSAQLLSGVAFIYSYEKTRLFCSNWPELSNQQRSFIGGAMASFVAQTLVLPVDVVSQHIIVMSSKYKPDSKQSRLTPIPYTPNDVKNSISRFKYVVKYVYSNYGLKGFYHGYAISLLTYVPNSAIWWGLYDRFCTKIFAIWPVNKEKQINRNDSLDLESSLNRLPIQLISATMAGITSSFLINPLDCIRVRMQVYNKTFQQAIHEMWLKDKAYFMLKGVVPRLIQSSIFSFWIILFYEPVKFISLKNEFRNKI